MPELITVHPDVVMQILRETPAVYCGYDAPRPKILTSCPQSQFCSLPTGEVCIYTPDQINQTTQFRPQQQFRQPQQTQQFRRQRF